MIRFFIFIPLLMIFVSCNAPANDQEDKGKKKQTPNILFAISDDQSYPYASAYGSKMVQTPNFDRIAREGVLFNNAFVVAPQCSPSRAAILTGMNIWQLEEAGTHSSYFPAKFKVFTDILEEHGYTLGYTGKPWGPGNWKDAGRSRNPVGPEYSEHTLDSVPYSGIRKLDYARNFKAFLDQKPIDQPFFFWYGASEPHRVFESGSGQKAGKTLSEAEVPSFLPNDSIVRSDLLDYAVEIEWFDKHLGEMLGYLEEAGELDNTIVVVTADNGMAFPYAKANLQEYGTHVPLAIAGPVINTKGRIVDDLISMVDLAPTFLEVAGVSPLREMVGHSLLSILSSDQSGLIDAQRTMVLTGRERHTHARPDNVGYPARAIRTRQYLYIQNLKPDRWPAGDPVDNLAPDLQGQDFKAIQPGYHDIDNSPSKTLVMKGAGQWPHEFQLALGKRPYEELFDIVNDPGCTQNLAHQPNLREIQEKLRQKLTTVLTEQGDPRMLGTGDVFESYPRFGRMRAFPGFKERGAYNESYKQKVKD